MVVGVVGTKLSLDGGLTPFQLITIRFLIAAILINVIFYKQIKVNISKESIKCGIILGVFLFIAFVVQTIGLVYTTPSKNAFLTAIILSTEAVFGTLFSIILLHEVITVRMIIGSTIIFTSIIMDEIKLSFLKGKKLNLDPVNIEATDEE